MKLREAVKYKHELIKLGFIFCTEETKDRTILIIYENEDDMAEEEVYHFCKAMEVGNVIDVTVKAMEEIQEYVNSKFECSLDDYIKNYER